jgi:L-amino acid N-acyltransferase YncA/2-polyprenyl-3-methyl-5-hydroxy-6-metoxy-1,4-benzoquinol methylase
MTDTTRDDIDQQRAKVIDRYSGLARQAIAGRTPTDACGSERSDCFSTAPYAIDEPVPQGVARASLGCGNPLAVADITPGETILDLGSGGGLDVILSARRTGPTGKVYGLDASPDMLTLARTNAARAGIDNAEFLAGHIEDIPLLDGSVDVVISNCVINLSADKPRVLAEAFRVLKPGGRLSVTDITSDEELDASKRATAEREAGCVSGTVTSDQYRDQLLAAGFTTATVTPTHRVAPGLTSVIVHATKPTAPAGVTIRPMRADDADQVLAIYQAGLDTGNASFETTAPTWDAFTATKLPLHRHVAVDTATGRLLGWVAATAVSSRRVYAGVIEHSVYIRPDTRGRGIATALLHALIGSTETAGVWTIQSGIFPENTASLRLHAKAGFRIIGIRHHIGQHHGRWRDVVFIERRSPTVGASPQ